MLKMREEIILKGKLFITPNKLYEPIIYIQYTYPPITHMSGLVCNTFKCSRFLLQSKVIKLYNKKVLVTQLLCISMKYMGVYIYNYNNIN